MSYYTKFQDVESILSATSTSATLGATDVLLGYSWTDGKAHAVPVAYVNGGGGAQILTTNSTATNITNLGLTLLKSTAGSSSDWLLSDPTVAGQVKTIVFASSTTSTRFSASPATASVISSAGFSNTMINMGSTQTGACVNSGVGVTLVSLSSTAWLVMGTQRNATSISSFVFAAGFGPVYS